MERNLSYLLRVHDDVQCFVGVFFTFYCDVSRLYIHIVQRLQFLSDPTITYQLSATPVNVLIKVLLASLH